MKLQFKRFFSTSQVLSYASTSNYKPKTNFKTDSWKFNYTTDTEETLQDILPRYLNDGFIHSIELFSEHVVKNSDNSDSLERQNIDSLERLNINIFNDADDDNHNDEISTIRIKDRNVFDVYIDIISDAIHKHVSSLKESLNELNDEDIYIVINVIHNQSKRI